jgi:hypothetical protein
MINRRNFFRLITATGAIAVVPVLAHTTAPDRLGSSRGTEQWITVADSLETTNGRVYPFHILRKLLAHFESNVKAGRELITLQSDHISISLVDVAAKVTDFRWVGSLGRPCVDEIQVKIHILDTPSGRRLKVWLSSRVVLYITPVGQGHITDDGRIETDYQFSHLNIATTSSFHRATRIPAQNFRTQRTDEDEQYWAVLNSYNMPISSRLRT